MEIEKGKIQEVWNYDHNKIVKYKQVIKNNTLNEVTEIDTENLNELISEVRKQHYGNMGIKAISKADFDKIIKIKFDNILEGFDKFNYVELYSRKDKEKIEIEEDFIKTLESFFYLNYDENKIIVDFYKNKLDKDSIEFIENNLDLEEIKIFNEILNSGTINDMFFEISDKKYIKLLTKLCTRELFFITFYFTKGPVTIWGNYNLKFPLFYDKDNIYEGNIKNYFNIAKSNNLL